MTNRLEGKVALITGTSPNIGGGIAEGMAAEGAKVVCLDIKADNANQCANYLQGLGAQAIGIQCDVTQEDQVAAAVEQASITLGPVDILVNNAAIFNQKGVLDMPVDEWRAQTDIILTGAFLSTKYVAKAMIAEQMSGSIINIVSTAGHQGQPGNVGYCTAKSGLFNFTRSVAMELAEYGIRVNSLTPTATDPTEGGARAMNWGRKIALNDNVKTIFDGFRKGVPMQQLPSPEHYAKAAIFLACDDSEMITGTDLRVDGGAVARYWAWDPSS